VADRFLARYHLGQDNRPDIIAFIRTAMGQQQQSELLAQPGAGPAAAEPSEAAKAELRTAVRPCELCAGGGRELPGHDARLAGAPEDHP
jgi:hypothetical protein